MHENLPWCIWQVRGRSTVSGSAISSADPQPRRFADLWDSLPFELLLVGHCVLVASWFIKLRDRFLFSYWVCVRAGSC